MSNTLRKRRTTPPYGGLGQVQKRNVSSVNRRHTPYGGRALPIPEKRQPLDSSPTPVFELGYRQMSSRFLLLASRFDSHAVICGVIGKKLDIKAQKECRRIAENIRTIAKRVLKWGDVDGNGKSLISDGALAAEKSWAAEQYIEFVTIAQEMIGERLNLNG